MLARGNNFPLSGEIAYICFCKVYYRKEWSAYGCLFFILLHDHIHFSVGNQANSQGILQFEGYGGPSVGFYNAAISSSDGNEISLFRTIGYHLGLGVVIKVTEQWQVVLQGEYLHWPIGIRQQITGVNFIENKDSAFGTNFGNYSLGARYSFPKEKFELYLQTALGVALNRDPPNFFWWWLWQH